MEEVNVEVEKERSLVFLERKIVVHISKSSGYWVNGIILEVGRDFFFIKDRLNGKEEMVFFHELKYPISIYNEKEEGE